MISKIAYAVAELLDHCCSFATSPLLEKNHKYLYNQKTKNKKPPSPTHAFFHGVLSSANLRWKLGNISSHKWNSVGLHSVVQFGLVWTKYMHHF